VDLHRLVAIELKIGEFQPGDKGRMELYLRWLERHERKDNEAAPILDGGAPESSP